MKTMRIIVLAIAATTLSGTAVPVLANEKAKVPPVRVEQHEDGEDILVHKGEASFYSQKFHGRTTASGEPMNQNKATAASRTLPLGAKATVTNEDNGKSVDVIVNDRGPYVDGRVIDLSRSAARKLDMIEDGTAPVTVEVKPSEQPTDTARDKVEAKVEQLTPDRQVADRESRRSDSAGTSGGTGSDTVSHSGSGK
ncbi:septal ring lytic transglycosylase RlpA family protein [Azospirillum humicireducens]|uniref:Endolytic peptidoglycan transglycosylase RlpA n=1 Tax=Azospirillum humicireducens TaxID=1226968 RepID=A0A160JDI9_9PROT|nr:septal ring lytic transglycosylase RlpA family protein [Azospirillum humicireducens]ANC90783.1 septal ring lytic transglycosylase RlpA family protein [Azospirillum humicireducens]